MTEQTIKMTDTQGNPEAPESEVKSDVTEETSNAEETAEVASDGGEETKVEESTEESQPETSDQTDDNEKVRSSYWQSEANKAQNQVKDLQEQLTQYIPEDERERFQQKSTINQLQEELVQRDIKGGYWEQQFPDLKYLPKTRLESVIRAAHQRNPENPGAVRAEIAETAAGAKEVAEIVMKEAGPKSAPDDAPAQAAVTPKSNMEEMSVDQVRKEVGKMNKKDLGKLWGRMVDKDNRQNSPR